MAFEQNGTLTTDKRQIDDAQTWDTQTDWEAYQSIDNITIETGILKLYEFSIPDTQDLKARYDFSVEDGSLPITDQTGNGNDLGTGSYSGVGVTINGVQAGEFDGVDDVVQTTWSTLSQPISIFAVYQYDALQSSGAGASARLFDGGSGTEVLYQVDGGANERKLFAGSNLSSGNPTTNAEIFGGIYDSTSSDLRVNGSELNTGDAGTNGMSGITLGGNGNRTENISDVNIGEVLVYTNDKTSKATDVEQYLSHKWGITI